MNRVYITCDFEAGWGAIGNDLWQARERAGVYRNLRPALRELIAHLDAREMSLSWAVVGAMIAGPDKAELSHLGGSYRTRAERFLADADVQTRDGRDLLDIVLGARHPQVFGTHGYSHVSFQDPEQGADGLAVELALAVAANRAAGIGAERLVFPRNEAAHLDLVRASGIAKVRLAPAGAPDTPRTRAGRALAALTRPSAPVTEVTRHDGLICHTGSEFFNWGAGADPVKRAITRRRLSRALSMASQGRGDVHFWLHPFNLVETNGLFTYFLTFIDEIGTLRDQGRIDVATF